MRGLVASRALLVLAAALLWAGAAQAALELRLVQPDGTPGDCPACVQRTHVDEAGERATIRVRERSDLLVRPRDVAAAVVFESAGSFEQGGTVTWLVVGLRPRTEEVMRKFVRDHASGFVALGSGERVLARTNVLALWPIMVVPFYDGRESLAGVLDLIDQPLRLVPFDEELTGAMQLGGTGLAEYVGRLERGQGGATQDGDGD